MSNYRKMDMEYLKVMLQPMMDSGRMIIWMDKDCWLVIILNIKEILLQVNFKVLVNIQHHLWITMVNSMIINLMDLGFWSLKIKHMWVILRMEKNAEKEL